MQNPLIRNAYAPPGMLQHPVERARRDDQDEIVAIARRFTGDDSARLTERWWQSRREAFSVVREADGDVAGFSVTATLDGLNDEPPEDPVIPAVAGHLSRDPMASGARAVLFRWALGGRHGEQPSPEVAALVVDLKRTYLELRATLRRVYTVVADWTAAAPVLGVMGFDPLEEVRVGDRAIRPRAPRLRPRRRGRVDRSPRPRRTAGTELRGGAPGSGQRRQSSVRHPGAEPGASDRPSLLTLTAREREVLALLAEGMTNAQLAQTLFISERTANRHVSNIYTKLGVHNRTQAARAAVAAGLAG